MIFSLKSTTQQININNNIFVQPSVLMAAERLYQYRDEDERISWHVPQYVLVGNDKDGDENVCWYL